MQNQGEREKIVSQYRQLMKKIKLESNESKRNELKKKASEIHDLLIRDEFDDKNVKRFSY